MEQVPFSAICCGITSAPIANRAATPLISIEPKLNTISCTSKWPIKPPNQQAHVSYITNCTTYRRYHQEPPKTKPSDQEHTMRQSSPQTMSRFFAPPEANYNSPQYPSLSYSQKLQKTAKHLNSNPPKQQNFQSSKQINSITFSHTNRLTVYHLNSIIFLYAFYLIKRKKPYKLDHCSNRKSKGWSRKNQHNSLSSRRPC